MIVCVICYKIMQLLYPIATKGVNHIALAIDPFLGSSIREGGGGGRRGAGTGAGVKCYQKQVINLQR